MNTPTLDIDFLRCASGRFPLGRCSGNRRNNGWVDLFSCSTAVTTLFFVLVSAFS
jgi:hypothetical protein